MEQRERERETAKLLSIYSKAAIMADSLVSHSYDGHSYPVVQIMRAADLVTQTSIHPQIQVRRPSFLQHWEQKRFEFNHSYPILMVPILTPEEEREYAVDETTFNRNFTNPDWLLRREYWVLDGAMRRLLCIRYVSVSMWCLTPGGCNIINHTGTARI